MHQELTEHNMIVLSFSLIFSESIGKVSKIDWLIVSKWLTTPRVNGTTMYDGPYL